MKLFFHGQGDRSVGINPTTFTIETNIILDAEDRRLFKETLKPVLEELGDDKVAYFHFECECPNCNGELKETRKSLLARKHSLTNEIRYEQCPRCRDDY